MLTLRISRDFGSRGRVRGGRGRRFVPLSSTITTGRSNLTGLPLRDPRSFVSFERGLGASITGSIALVIPCTSIVVGCLQRFPIHTVGEAGGGSLCERNESFEVHQDAEEPSVAVNVADHF